MHKVSDIHFTQDGGGALCLGRLMSAVGSLPLTMAMMGE